MYYFLKGVCDQKTMRLPLRASSLYRERFGSKVENVDAKKKKSRIFHRFQFSMLPGHLSLECIMVLSPIMSILFSSDHGVQIK